MYCVPISLYIFVKDPENIPSEPTLPMVFVEYENRLIDTSKIVVHYR